MAKIEKEKNRIIEFAKKERMEMLEKAVYFAEKAHKGQRRKNGDEYIIHPLRVANKMISHGISEEVLLVSALLHDVVEDTELELEDIEKEFGKEVKEIVDFLSKRKGEKEEEYIDRVRRNEKARIVKAYDAYDNLNDLKGLEESMSREWVERKKRQWKAVIEEFGTKELKEELRVMQNNI